MKVSCKWNEKLSFIGDADGHMVSMDAKPPVGSDSGMTPKQMVVVGLCGCTAMDVVSLLKKYKQPLDKFEIEADVTMTEEGHPVVFKSVQLTFRLSGSLEKAKVLEAVQLSQSKFCGVSAMLSKAVPIQYRVEINGQDVGSGKADFSR